MIKWAMRRINPNPKEYDYVFHDVLKIIAKLSQSSLLELYAAQNKPCSFKKQALVPYLTLYKKGTPLAYIINQTTFYGLDLYVDNSVLIPRVETEQLVAEMISLIKTNFGTSSCLIYEIGTGSGAIALAIAQALPNVNVVASDISATALLVAKKNQKKLKIKNVSFIHGDLITPFLTLNKKCDVFIFNPPYLDKTSPDVQKSVRDFEPDVALFAPNKGIAFYCQYLQDYTKICNPHHIMGFEIGYDLKQNINEYLLQNNFSQQQFYFLKDLNGL